MRLLQLYCGRAEHPHCLHTSYFLERIITAELLPRPPHIYKGIGSTAYN